MSWIDLNCDIGESFGAWTMGQDAEVMPHISSANIACGFHAGDPSSIRRTVALALASRVAIGAHPSLPDLVGFGRRRMAVSEDETYALLVYQIGAVAGFARAAGAGLHHVKLHGALYNMVFSDRTLAGAVCQAVVDVDPKLRVVAQAGSVLAELAEQAGLGVLREGFADRRYMPDASLAPRDRPGAVIEGIDEAVAQGLRLARDGRVTCIDGSDLDLRIDTLCVHGDRPNAAAFARGLRAALDQAGISVRAGVAHNPEHSQCQQ